MIAVSISGVSSPQHNTRFSQSNTICIRESTKRINFAVFDILEDSVRCNGTTICVAWREYEDFVSEVKVTAALTIAPVEGTSNTYRRVEWLEDAEADFFENEYRNVILV